MPVPTIADTRVEALFESARRKTGCAGVVLRADELEALCRAFLAPEPPPADLLAWAVTGRAAVEERRQAEPRDPAKTVTLISRAIDAVRQVRDDCFKAKHRVDEGVCEAVLILLRKLRDSQER